MNTHGSKSDAKQFVPGSTSNPFREARELLEQAETLRQQRKLDRAESIGTTLVRKYPDYFGAQHTLGLTYADKGDYRRAAAHLVQAAMLNPRSWSTLTALAGVYIRLDANEMAEHTLERARALNPKEPSILTTLGELYNEEREYEFARDTFRNALDVELGMEEAAVGLAHAYTSLGQHTEAAEVLDGQMKRGGNSLAVLGAVAALPASEIRCDLLAELDKVVQRPTESKVEFENIQAFARVAALDKAGRYIEAWDQARAANRAVASLKETELAGTFNRLQANLKWLQSNLIKIKPSAGSDGKLPLTVFILGPSRSGKTTMESLFSSLDGIKRGYENPSVENAISRAYQDAGLLTSHSLDQLPPQFYPHVRKNYAEELTRRAASARVFTNTHPGYMYDAARIIETLPNVRFVFVKRNLDDIILRIFMRLYRRGNAYAYNLQSARDYVLLHYRMFDLIAEAFPKLTRVLKYEDIVRDPGAALHVVTDLCGIQTINKPLPSPGNDVDCALPYRDLMAAELAH